MAKVLKKEQYIIYTYMIAVTPTVSDWENLKKEEVQEKSWWKQCELRKDKQWEAVGGFGGR